MLASVLSYGLIGISGFAVRTEVDLSSGMPGIEIVGLPDAAVRESKERVRAALTNSGFVYPEARITVNLAPADMKKEGPAFDLPIAVGILCAAGVLDAGRFENTALLGELSLDGSLRPVRGALPIVISAKEADVSGVILPAENAPETRCVEGVEVWPARTLRQVVDHLRGKVPLAPVQKIAYATLLGQRSLSNDFQYVRGQRSAKRALEIAAAGGHNVLMVGAPGSGKTLLARCLPGILPDMSFEEALEVTRIHSAAGAPPENGLLTERPFRAPHHSASSASLVGGGLRALPGEISKAHHGVLFLDELPEYRRDLLESLRQPMEDGFVTVTRVSAQVTYPSSFMLVCSMNPCPCGHYGSRTRPCRCSQSEIRRYLSRVSGPLLDRIDLHIEVESVPAERIAKLDPEEASLRVRERVEAARARQRERYRGMSVSCNARLDARTLNDACPMEPDARELLMKACDAMGLSNRGFTRVLKVARTIADLEGKATVEMEHIAEAVQYRSLDKKYWG